MRSSQTCFAPSCPPSDLSTLQSLKKQDCKGSTRTYILGLSKASGSVTYGPKGDIDTLGHFREVSQFQDMNSVFLVTSFFLMLVLDTEEGGERVAAERQQLHLLAVEC